MIEYKKNTWNNINRDVENEDTRGRNTDGKEDGEKRALNCQGVPFPRAGQHKFMTEEMKKKRKSALIVTRPSSAREKDQQATCPSRNTTAQGFQTLVLVSQATCEQKV